MINPAILGNNVAASKIQIGQFSEAIKDLTLAISNIKEGLGNQVERAELHSTNSSYTLELLISQSLQRSRCEQDENIKYIYSESVHIPMESPQFMEPPLAVVSTVLIFNLALALHMWGEETTAGTSRKSRLSKALSLYRLVSSCDMGNTLLCMIVLNNVGLIHKRCNNRKVEHECFRELLMLWLSSPVHLKQQLEGMISNVLRCGEGDVLHAAAA